MIGHVGFGETARLAPRFAASAAPPSPSTSPISTLAPSAANRATRPSPNPGRAAGDDRDLARQFIRSCSHPVSLTSSRKRQQQFVDRRRAVRSAGNGLPADDGRAASGICPAISAAQPVAAVCRLHLPPPALAR